MALPMHFGSYSPEDLRSLDNRISGFDERIAQSVKEDPVAKRLLELRGIGPLTASALAGALGDGTAFSKGREFAASLGLTPRQHSTGGNCRRHSKTAAICRILK